MKDWILITLLNGEKTCGQIRKVLFNETLGKAKTYDAIKKASERAMAENLVFSISRNNQIFYGLTRKGKKKAQALLDYYQGILWQLTS